MKRSLTFTRTNEYLNIPRPTFTREELTNLKNLFKLYNSEKDGFIKPMVLLQGLKTYGIDKSCPQLFDIICGLNNNTNNDNGVTAQELIDEVQQKFGEKMDRKEVRRIFELFLKDKTQDSIFLADVKKTCADMNLDYSHHDLLMMLKDSSALKNEMSFDEFYVMMTEKLIHIN